MTGYNRPSNTPKDHFQTGVRYESYGLALDALLEFQKAHSAEPKNAKYAKKSAELAPRAAAVAVMLAGHCDASPEIKNAWLSLALSLDPGNAQAKTELNSASQEEARVRAILADTRTQALQGNFSRAEEQLRSVAQFATAGSLKESYSSTNAFVDAAETLSRAEGNAKMGAFVQAQADLDSAEAYARRDPEFQLELATVRKRLAIDIFSYKANDNPERYNLDELNTLMERLDLVERLDPSLPAITQRRGQVEKAISQNVTSTAKMWDGKERSPRITLEVLSKAGQHLKSQGYALAIRDANDSAYPGLRLRLVVTNPQECPHSVSKDEIASALTRALAPVAVIDPNRFDLTVTVAVNSCLETDLPRQNVEHVNSTYIAGTIQQSNPSYIQAEQIVSAAEADLSRATVAYSNNPNFFTGLMLGRARRQLNDAQNRLSAISPYLSEPVRQQYSYEKFQAVRAYAIEGSISNTGAREGFDFSLERTVKGESSEQQRGISGVLSQDTSGVTNEAPTLQSMEIHAARAADRFISDLTLAVREAVAQWFAAQAVNAKSGREQLTDLLYLEDIAAQTTYSKYRSGVDGIIDDALQLGPGNSRLVKLPFSQPESYSVASGQATSGVSVSPGLSPEQILTTAIEGLVSVAADEVLGSGFFINQCLVVTNEHVVHGAESIVLRTSTKHLLVANLVAADEHRDLALLRSNAKGCHQLTLDVTGRVKIGDDVYAIGSPLGLTNTVTKGIVSALRTESGTAYVQADVSINPGNSGGPFLSSTGKVIGVTTFKRKGAQGLSFAVAASEITKAFAPYLKLPSEARR